MNSEHLTVMFVKDKMTLQHAFKCHLNSITIKTTPVCFYITMINVDQFKKPYSVIFAHLVLTKLSISPYVFFCITLLSASSSSTDAMGHCVSIALVTVNAPLPLFFWDFPLPQSNDQQIQLNGLIFVTLVTKL